MILQKEELTITLSGSHRMRSFTFEDKINTFITTFMLHYILLFLLLRCLSVTKNPLGGMDECHRGFTEPVRR